MGLGMFGVGAGRSSGKRTLPPVTIGVTLCLAALVVGLALFNKGRIVNAVTPGDVVQITFARDYKLREFVSAVKVSGVPVGKVQAVDQASDGSARVEVKIDSDVWDKLGSRPSASIRPTTLLGGFYYVELTPGGAGGEFDGNIPVDRTTTPVELDSVARALQPSALEGIQSGVRNLDKTLAAGGTRELDRLIGVAPDALDPAADVLTALRGTRPRSDLTRLVRGLESTARVLTEKQGQLDSIVDGLATTSQVLGHRAGELAETVQQLPRTLDTAHVGLARLSTTLIELERTAEVAGPVVRELNTTLTHVDPVLVKARPLVTDLRGVLVDTRPLVQDLVPVSRQATNAMRNLNGPVLRRVNGPIMTFLHSPYSGSGMYAGSGSDKPVYQEVGFLFANLLREVASADRNGHFLNVHAGVGPGSVAGLPISLDQLVKQLTRLQLSNSEGGTR